jgi:mannosyltransferase
MTSAGRISGSYRLADAQTMWLAVPLLVMAALLRFVGLHARWLRHDELLAANWSVHGPWPALVHILRFDLHPPLHYLQLSLWAKLGTSDFWLMTNTVLWSLRRSPGRALGALDELLVGQVGGQP